MAQPIHVLSVENEEDDTELVMEHLRRGGFAPDWERVETPQQMRDALARRPWDIILSDYVMPAFSGSEALALLKETQLDIPFIIVSGSVGEEVAVKAMKAGAQDFFRKDKLALLSSAVERELREAGERRERRRVTSELHLSTAQQELMLESIKDHAIFTVSIEGTLSSWSPAVERLMGYDAASFIGRPVSLLFPPEDLEHGVPANELQSAKEKGRFQIEGWRLRKDGSQFWASTSIAPIIDEHGAFKGYSKVMRDVSERKRLIDELQSAVRLREEFISVASHELKTPLTSLRLQLQSTQRMLAGGQEPPSQERLEQKLAASLRHVERLGRLIDELLEVTRIESGRLRLYREVIDLAEHVREVASRLEPMRAASRCPLGLELEAPLTASVDPLRFESLLTNLLANAFKFGASEPVTVRLARSGLDIYLEVTDCGIGISEEDQSRIFRRFERAVSDNHYGGFGVGLWLVKEIAEAHGGGVSVRSAPRQGTTFTVRFPAPSPSATNVHGS